MTPTLLPAPTADTGTDYEDLAGLEALLPTYAWPLPDADDADADDWAGLWSGLDDDDDDTAGDLAGRK